MIRIGAARPALPSGPILVAPDVLERIAYQSGRHIEFTRDAGYLVIGRTTYRAELPPVDGAL